MLSAATSLVMLSQKNRAVHPRQRFQIILGEMVFSTQISPTGSYTPIIGHPSRGIAWYINDILIPEITVERGQTYTFMIEGGDDSTNPARYHPFYITNSSEGGFGQKIETEQRKQKIFAGVAYNHDAYAYPTAAGRYCKWVHRTIDKSAEKETFQEFFDTLRLDCEPSAPAVFNWTVPADAPDLLYYQCYTHTNLGWKINVVNPGYISQQNGDNTNGAQSPILSILLSICGLFAVVTIRFHNVNSIF